MKSKSRLPNGLPKKITKFCSTFWIKRIELSKKSLLYSNKSIVSSKELSQKMKLTIFMPSACTRVVQNKVTTTTSSRTTKTTDGGNSTTSELQTYRSRRSSKVPTEVLKTIARRTGLYISTSSSWRNQWISVSMIKLPWIPTGAFSIMKCFMRWRALTKACTMSFAQKKLNRLVYWFLKSTKIGLIRYGFLLNSWVIGWNIHLFTSWSVPTTKPILNTCACSAQTQSFARKSFWALLRTKLISWTSQTKEKSYRIY